MWLDEDVYKETLQELQQCDNWIEHLEKLQSPDTFVPVLVSALTGLSPKKEWTNPGVMAFLQDCTTSTIQEKRFWCHSFPEWDGFKVHA